MLARHQPDKKPECRPARVAEEDLPSQTIRRRPGLQRRWAYVVNSLQRIVPSYELASSRISLHADARMRSEVVRFAVAKRSLVLDLGAGPGTLSRVVRDRGGDPVLLD